MAGVEGVAAVLHPVDGSGRVQRGGRALEARLGVGGQGKADVDPPLVVQQHERRQVALGGGDASGLLPAGVVQASVQLRRRALGHPQTIIRLDARPLQLRLDEPDQPRLADLGQPALVLPLPVGLNLLADRLARKLACQESQHQSKSNRCARVY